MTLAAGTGEGLSEANEIRRVALEVDSAQTAATVERVPAKADDALGDYNAGQAGAVTE